MPAKAKLKSEYTEEQLKSMSREEIIYGMNDREIAFCENYIQDYNPKIAAVKAGYNPVTIDALKLRRRPKVINYIAWLKLELYYQANVKAVDILNSYARMGFYDITDYIEVKGNKMKLKSFDEIDGSIIQEITQSASGITVKFPDRIKALEKLENFMDVNPFDWKRKIEEQKLEIMREKVEIEKAKIGMYDEIEDDGFIEALENASKTIEYEEENDEDDNE